MEPPGKSVDQTLYPGLRISPQGECEFENAEKDKNQDGNAEPAVCEYVVDLVKEPAFLGPLVAIETSASELAVLAVTITYISG